MAAMRSLPAHQRGGPEGRRLAVIGESCRLAWLL